MKFKMKYTPLYAITLMITLGVGSLIYDAADVAYAPFTMTDNDIEQAYKTIRKDSRLVVDVNINKSFKLLSITHQSFDTDSGSQLSITGKKRVLANNNKEAERWCEVYPEIKAVRVHNTQGYQKAEVRCN